MRKILLALCAVAVFVPVAPAYAGMGKAAEEEALRNAVLKAQNGDAQGMAEILKPAFADPDFFLLTAEEQHMAYRLLGAAYVDNGQSKEALPLLKRATAAKMADGVDWYYRLAAAYSMRDNSDAIKSLTELAKHWPDKLAQLKDIAISQLIGEARKGELTRERTLLEALAAAKWYPQDQFWLAEGFYFELMRLRSADGDITGALAAAASLESPWSIIEIRADKRFDAMVKAKPGQFDLDKTAVHMLSDAKVRMAKRPDKLAAVNAVAELLLQMNRAAEALPLLEAAVARANLQDGKQTPFADTVDEIRWTMNLQSQVLLTLGRSDEALAVLVYAARQPESGQMNVSQAINLADLYDMLGRPKDALDTIADLDAAPISLYGKMALADARACAYVQQNESEKLAETLAYMKSHASDGMQPYLNTLLCTDDLTGTARLVIAELKIPERRADMLKFLQNYVQPSHLSAIGGTHRDRLAAVRARRDVQEEIAKVGRIESYALLPPDY